MVQRIIKFIVGALWGKIVLWWTQRKLTQAQAAADLARQRLESLTTGQAVESQISAAAQDVITANAGITDVQKMLEELQKRADARAKE